MGIEEYRHALGEATGHGWGFLTAYGVTWLVCTVAWRRWGPKVGAYCTLFQGMVALPVALLLTAATPGPARPTLAAMDGLSVLLATGQLLGLPVVIYWVAQRNFTRTPLAMVILLAVHFAPYSWLYDTVLYVAMGAVMSVGAVIADVTAHRNARSTIEAESIGAARTCLATGLVMLISAGIALWL